MSKTDPFPPPYDFPPTGRDDWLRVIERDLKGADFDRRLVTSTLDGDIQPLYGSEDAVDSGAPGQAPWTRGLSADAHPWSIRQAVHQPDPADANAAALSELAGDTNELLLAGPVTAETLSQILQGVDPAVPIALTARASLDAARALAATGRSGVLGVDPLGTLVEGGALSHAVPDFVRQAAELRAPGRRVFQVRTSPWHDAGASAIQELAFALSSGVLLLRELESQGLEQAFGDIEFSLALGPDFFQGIATIRALRRLWGQVAQSCGYPGSAHIHVHAGARHRTERAPWVNTLRETVVCFAGAVGGAQAITTQGFDAALGRPGASSRRTARNTQHILLQEAHLARVVDPAGGSWMLERRTQELADEAWSLFQELEAEGGGLHALQSGRMHELVDNAHGSRRSSVVRRKTPITGVSTYPALGEVPPSPPPYASAPRPLQAGAAEVPLPKRPVAAPFEALRDLSDARLVAKGHRPRAFVASLDDLASHTARTDFARNLLEAGGIEAAGGTGWGSVDELVAAFTASHCRVAVVCGSEASYARWGPQAVAALKARRATIWLAGRPDDPEPWTEAGAAGFMYLGCDAVRALKAIWEVAQ